MTRMEVELKCMQMSNQGIGGGKVLAHDAAQRESIRILRKALNSILGFLDPDSINDRKTDVRLQMDYENTVEQAHAALAATEEGGTDERSKYEMDPRPHRLF